MSDLFQPPPGGDQDRASMLYGLYWTMFTVGLIFTSARFYSRIVIRALGLDDWIMAFTMLLVGAIAVIGTIMGIAGSFRHTYYLFQDDGLDRLVTVSKLFIIVQPFGFMSLATARVSVAVLVLRIMGQSGYKWRKHFLRFSIISTLLVNAICCVLFFAGYYPVETAWNPFIPGVRPDPNISINFAIFASSWGILMDFCLAILPMTIFWSLNLSVEKRFGLCALMGMGIFAGISGIIKTTKIAETLQDDVTWATFDLLIWHGVETFLIVVSGCLPTLKPIYDQVHRRWNRDPSTKRFLLEGSYLTHQSHPSDPSTKPCLTTAPQTTEQPTSDCTLISNDDSADIGPIIDSYLEKRSYQEVGDLEKALNLPQCSELE